MFDFTAAAAWPTGPAAAVSAVAAAWAAGMLAVLGAYAVVRSAPDPPTLGAWRLHDAEPARSRHRHKRRSRA